MKQLLESLDRIDEGGRVQQEKTPAEEAAFKKEFPPLKIGDVDNSRWGKGRKILSATTSADGTVWRAADGQIWSVKYEENPAPTRSVTQAQPAEVSANAANELRKADLAKNQTYPQSAPVNNQYYASPTPGANASIDQQAQAGTQTTMGGLTADQVKTMLTTVRQLIGANGLVARENTVFKSLIGRALLESFDLKLFEDADLDTMNKIWPQLVKWADTNKTAPEAQEIENLKDKVLQWTSSQQQSHIIGSDAATRNQANSASQSTEPEAAAPVVAEPEAAAPVVAEPEAAASVAPAPVQTSNGASIASGASSSGNASVDASVKKVVDDPDAAARVADPAALAAARAQDIAKAGNTVPVGTNAEKYAAYNQTTGASYDNDTIGPGSKDSGTDHRVADLQKKLGITPATGVYGDAEKKAVSALQQKYSIKVDGKYGPATRTAFEKDTSAITNKKGTGDQQWQPTAKLHASPESGKNANYTPDEIKAAEEALNDPTIKASEKKFYQNIVDAQKEKTNTSADTQRPGLDAKGKPDVYDRQKQLAELGAKGKDGQILKPDGVKGEDTRKAEKEFGYLIIDPKTMVKINDISAPRIITPQGIKNAQTWIKAVKAGTQKMEQVPPVYADIVKKALSIKENYETGNQSVYSEDQSLARIVQLARG